MTNLGGKMNHRGIGDEPTRKVRGKGKRYSLMEKRAALTAYLITGSVTRASHETGVDNRRIHEWMKKDWWEAWQDEILTQLGSKLTAKMRGVALKAYIQLEDRLDEGDIGIYQDEVFRHPIKAKELAIIGGISSDKVRIAEGKATSRTERVDLNQMAAAFEKIGDKYIEKIGTQMSGTRPVIEGEAIKTALPGDKSK